MTASELPRRPLVPSNAVQQDLVHLPNQAQGQWEALSQATPSVIERADVVLHLFDVVPGSAAPGLCVEHLSHRCLRALDTRAQDRLSGDVAVGKQVGIGYLASRAC